MRMLVIASVLGFAAASVAPLQVLDARDIGFKVNVLKSTGGTTNCPEKTDGDYTVVSVLRTDKDRARILNPYMVKLLMQCHVQEVHTWDLWDQGDGRLAGELDNFEDQVPEMLKLWDDWRERHIRSKWASFYDNYQVPDREKAVLLKVEDSVLYMDVGSIGEAARFTRENKDNFLTIPNIVSGSTAQLHQKCLPKGFDLMTKSNDELTADTHRFFLKDPLCFSQNAQAECLELDDQLDNSNLPLGAYLVQWEKIQDVANLLKISHGESKALIAPGSNRRSCLMPKATMASICPSNKRATQIYMPVYKMLSKKIQHGGRITDEGLSQEILRINGLDQNLPKTKRILFVKDTQTVAEPATCPRIRSYLDVGQCNAPQKQHKWLQLENTVPAECRRPCTAAPPEIQGVHFVSEEKKLALFSSPKLTKPLLQMIHKNLNDTIQAAHPETLYESKDYNVVISAREPLDSFAYDLTLLMKGMKQIGVDKLTLKQTIADCRASPDTAGCKSLLHEKLPVLEKWIDLESFDHFSGDATSFIQSVFKDIKRLVYPGCEAQLGSGTTPQMAAFLPSYLQTQAKKPFHVIREEHAEADLQELWQKLGMKVGSSLAEFGFESEAKSTAEIQGAAKDLRADITDAVSLLEMKQEMHATQNRDATIAAMEEILQDANANVEAVQDVENIKSLIKEDAELTKSFCSIYSMDYSCLGYIEEFEKICGGVEAPEKVTMKKEFILKVSTPKLALRRKVAVQMRMLSEKSCVAKSNSEISFISFVDTVENCKAHCESKQACQSFNYDEATFGCRLYNDDPVGTETNLHTTCGAMCKDNDEGVANAMEAKGLKTIGSSCESAAEYCSQDDIMLNCPVTCGHCEVDI